MKKSISNILRPALVNSALLLAAALAPAGLAADCLTVICPTNKVAACGSEWDFDPPTVLTNLDQKCTGLCRSYAVTVVSTVTNGNCLQYNIGRTWAITNACGEYHSCAQTVSVINTNQPVFQGATNIDLYSCGSTQVFFNVTATEPCCGSLPVTCGPPSGYSFPPGATLVGCSTIDCCGRTFNTSFYVYVHPTGVMAAYCPDKYVAFGDTNWTFDPPSVTDDCCPGNYTFVPQTPVTNQASGLMIITEGWLVIDSCSQADYCTETVYITNTPPVTYDISWHKVASGGGTVAGGAYAISGTAGQWDAGRMSGVNLTFDGGLWALFGGASSNSFSGLGFCSNQITGTLSFNNSNPAILSLLNSDEGLKTYLIYSDSLSAGRSGDSGTHPATGSTSTGYAITVDAGCTNTAGISYVLTPQVSLGSGGQQYYYFNAKTSPPVVAGQAGPVVNFEECLGVIQLNFVDSQGAPLSVDGGRIIADAYSEELYSIPNGATQQRFYVRGGDQSHSFAITLYIGTNIYSDRLTYYLNTNFTVACDAILDVNMVVPAAGTLGQITGTMDMLREFEWTIPSEFLGYYQDLTGVRADNGPFANERWTSLYGDNATIPSSGTFQLINLVPSGDDPASPGYAVHGHMAIRTNRMFELFQTPVLGSGSNPAVVVTPGATVNLGNIFQIDPGYLRGAIRLQGPTETPNHLSMLRGILHCGDDDKNHDGIPDRAGGNNGFYYSFVEYQGVDHRATGAQYTAAGGYGTGDFDGTFDASSSSFLGHHELVLGGLQGERSLWHHDYFGLWLTNPGWTGFGDDYDGYMEINVRSTPQIEVVPGQPVTDDLAYGFSEVIVRIFSPSGDFTRPSVSFHGGLTGPNFLGQLADYSVPYDVWNGTPYDQPTNLAQVRVLLPEGTYTLNPSVRVGGGSVGLAPIDLTVGAGQLLDLGNCLRLDLVIPTHVTSNLLSLAGSVLTSCSNSVLDVSYQLNGAAPLTVCTNCGANPTFNFTVPLVEGANSLSVTAHDDQGAASSISGTIQLEVPPPSLTIFLTSSNTVFISWPSPSTGFRLVQSSDLGAGNWSTAPDPVTDNGTIRFIVVNPQAGNRFYRLVKP